MPGKEDGDRCGLQCVACGPWAVGYSQSALSWLLGTLGTVLRRWCTGASECLTACVAVAGLGWGRSGPSESGLRSQARSWILSFKWNNYSLVSLLLTLLSPFFWVLLSHWVRSGLFCKLLMYFLRLFVVLGVPLWAKPGVSLFERTRFVCRRKDKPSCGEMGEGSALPRAQSWRESQLCSMLSLSSGLNVRKVLNLCDPVSPRIRTHWPLLGYFCGGSQSSHIPQNSCSSPAALSPRGRAPGLCDFCIPSGPDTVTHTGERLRSVNVP